MSAEPSPWADAEVQSLLSLVAEDSFQRAMDRVYRSTEKVDKLYKKLAKLMGVRGYSRTSTQCREKLNELKSDYEEIKDLQNGSRRGSNSNSDREITWKWFERMDAIYGHRPANNGRESGPDSARYLLEALDAAELSAVEENCNAELQPSPSSQGSSNTSPARQECLSTHGQDGSAPAESTPSSMSPQTVTTGKRKRSLYQQENTAVVTACLRDMQADHIAQQDRQRAQMDRHLQLLRDDARAAREQDASLRREQWTQNAEFNRSLLGLLGQLAEAIRDPRV